MTECATETLSATDQTDNSRSNVTESSSCLDNTAVPMIEIVNSNNTAAEQDTDVVSTVCGLELDNTMPKTKTKTKLTYLERLLRRSKMHKHEMVQLCMRFLQKTLNLLEVVMTAFGQRSSVYSNAAILHYRKSKSNTEL